MAMMNDYWSQFQPDLQTQPVPVGAGAQGNAVPNMGAIGAGMGAALVGENTPGQPQPGWVTTAPGYRPGLQGAELQQFLTDYFTAQGVGTEEVPYWMGEWANLEARGRELNDPNYAMMRLGKADALVRAGKATTYGGGQGGGFGSLNQMDTAQFGGINSVTDPGYQFRLSEGLKGIERSAAAKGTLLTGGTLKALTGYATGMANQGYGDDWQRAMSQFQTNYGVRKGERDSIFDRNYRLSDLGLRSVS